MGAGAGLPGGNLGAQSVDPPPVQRLSGPRLCLRRGSVHQAELKHVSQQDGGQGLPDQSRRQRQARKKLPLPHVKGQYRHIGKPGILQGHLDGAEMVLPRTPRTGGGQQKRRTPGVLTNARLQRCEHLPNHPGHWIAGTVSRTPLLHRPTAQHTDLIALSPKRMPDQGKVVVQHGRKIQRMRAAHLFRKFHCDPAFPFYWEITPAA